MTAERPKTLQAIDAEAAMLKKAVAGRYALPDLRTIRQSGPFSSVQNFFDSSFAFFQHIRRNTAVKRTSRVLDFGCGFGRMAIPFSAYLDREVGFYCGIDTDPKAIRTNRETFKGLDHLEFRHVDIHSKRYNPAGKPIRTLREARFAAPFDLVFLFSVFTHVLPEDLDELVGFLAGSLAADGEILSTWFLLDDETDAAIARGVARRTFATPYGPARIDRPDIPEAAVAYPEDLAVEAFRRAGFADVRVQHGTWRGTRASGLGQDTILARR